MSTAPINTLPAASFSRSCRDYIKLLGRLADKHRLPAFMVGGAVRDALLGRPVRDLDFTFERDPRGIVEELGQLLRARLVHYPQFFTHTPRLPDGVEIDCATFRSESYARAGALPEVKPGTLCEDLFRRDFTVNAMSIRLTSAGRVALIDPFEGRADLIGGVLRVMHLQSFTDDPTRIFRLARFMARFGYRADIGTLCSKDESLAKGLIAGLSLTRAKHELLAVFGEDRPGLPLGLLERWGCLRQVHRKLSYSPASRFPGSRVPAYLNFAVLLKAWDPDEALALLRGMQMPGVEREEIGSVLRMLADKAPLIGRALSPAVMSVLPYLGADGKKILVRLRRRDVAALVGGKDLRRWGYAPGPLYREIIAAVEKARNAGAITTAAQAKKFVIDTFVRVHKS